jgi:hypothetical protein
VAFDIRDLSEVRALGSNRWAWYYTTADTLATVLGADYFSTNAGLSRLHVGDVLDISASSGTEFVEVSVSSVANSSVLLAQGTVRDRTSADNGNASVVLLPLSEGTQRYATALAAAAKTVTLPAVDVANGREFTVVRESTCTGAFDLNIIARATGSVVFSGQPSDADTVTISDGVHTATVFEFDDNSAVTDGRTAVTIGATAAATAQALVTALNAITTGLTVTASLSGLTVRLVNDAGLSSGNVTVTKSGATITVTGMAGGGTLKSLADAATWATVKNDGGTWRLKAAGSL